MKVTTLRARHIKGCIDEGTAIINGEERSPSAGVKSRIKSLFNLMLDYAVEYEIVDKNYARTFNLSDDIIKEKDTVKKKHISMTDEEMDLLWQNINKIPYVDVMLIQCYSGWRPQELGLIKIENVDLHNWSFIGGMKSEAGIDRIVPIHTKIRHLVERKYQEALEIGSAYLINCLEQSGRSGKMLTYEKYQKRFAKVVAELKLNEEHRPHDPRKHFVTMAKKYQVDEYAIKHMIGHSITDITERVYTERDVEWLRNEMEKIR
jgi:integrase